MVWWMLTTKRRYLKHAYGMLRNGSLQTGDNVVVPLEFSNHAVTVNVSGGMSAAGRRRFR